MEYITEPERMLPVSCEADLCVIGGSCTGVFAAVRAARLGARVVLIEKQNGLGGTAAGGLVNVWHGLYDTEGKNQIIAGLTYEMILRLKRRGALEELDNVNAPYTFSPAELKIELDELVNENRIHLLLHTMYAGLAREGERIKAAIIENKDGRSAVRAGFFIDASGDGDLMRDAGFEGYVHGAVQPPSSCFLLQGSLEGLNLSELFYRHGAEFGLPDDWGWGCRVPGCRDLYMRADTHVFGVLCSRADDLTRAETEGRRNMRAVVDLLRKYGRPNEQYAIVNPCSHIGIRDTMHYPTRFCAQSDALLRGTRYPDAVLNGTYRVDIHHSDDSGITFMNLQGRKWTIRGRSGQTDESNWREEMGLSGEPAVLYQVPFDILVQERCENLIAAGRMLHADTPAFGALRVMVNLNQLGEAAGIAAYLSLHRGRPVQALDAGDVRRLLREGGSAVL